LDKGVSMANAPGHRFGQIIGEMLEEILTQKLQTFCDERGLFLDKKGPRGKVRRTKKVRRIDSHGNSHDLDFVIEKGGSLNDYGRPVAFIEAAWRAKTKHSRAKAQEIQGAVLPIAETFHWDSPFLGAILAGVFTNGALEQMKTNGFRVTLFPAETIRSALSSVGIKITFGDDTPDADFLRSIDQYSALPRVKHEELKQHIVNNNQKLIDQFLAQLQNTLDRQIDQIILIPLHGNQNEFRTVVDAISFVNNFQEDVFRDGGFRKYEIIVRYTNNDKIDASFQSKANAIAFLHHIERGVIA